MNESGADGDVHSDITTDKQPSHFSSLKSRVKARIPFNRPLHDSVDLPPNEFYKVPGDPLPSYSPGESAYEFTASDWKAWIINAEALRKTNWKAWSEKEGLSLIEETPYPEDQLKRMGVLTKAFVDGVKDIYNLHKLKGTLPEGLKLPPIFFGNAGVGNLACVTADGNRIILGNGQLGSLARSDMNKVIEHNWSHGQITPLQRVALAGVHEGDHIVYKATHPETKTANYFVKPEGPDVIIQSPPGDESQSAYDAKPIELPAVMQELDYAISHKYPPSVIEALQERIDLAKKKRQQTSSR